MLRIVHYYMLVIQLTDTGQRVKTKESKPKIKYSKPKIKVRIKTKNQRVKTTTTTFFIDNVAFAKENTNKTYEAIKN